MFTICLIFTFVLISCAQWINQMSINPSNPVTDDFISFNYNADFPAAGCDLINYNVSIFGNIIYVDAYHEQGMLTMICNSNQTFPIGNLNEGSYTLNLYLYIPGYSTSGTLNFNVTGPVGMTPTAYETEKFLLYPNPASDKLHFETNIPFSRIQIFNSKGLIIRDMPFSSETDLQSFTSGLYILVLSSENDLMVRKVAIVK